MQESSLLGLPDELLLEVGRHVDRDGALSTSLTCRRLQRAGQEQLIRTHRVRPSRLWKLASTLHVRPDLAKVYSHLQIGDLDLNEYNAIEWTSSREDKANAQISCYMHVISQKFPLFTAVEEAGLNVSLLNCIRLGVMVLLALAPKICAIHISSNLLDVLGDLLGFCCHPTIIPGEAPAEHWAGQVRNSVESVLERLVVTRDKQNVGSLGRRGQERSILTTGYRTKILDTSRCRRLEALQSPCTRLPKPFSHASPMLLPRSLKRLCMNAPANNSTEWRAQMDNLVASGDRMPCLQLVDLRFQYNKWSTAWDLCYHRENGRSDLTRFQAWTSSSFRLITTFGNIKRFIDKDRNLHATPTAHEEGDIIAGLELCLAIPYTDMEQHPDIIDALGCGSFYVSALSRPSGSNYRGPIVLRR